MADEDLERPSLVPAWLTVVVVALAVVGLLAIVGWIVRLALGLVKWALLAALIVGVVALVRAATRRR